MIYELGTFSAPNGVIRIKEGIAGLILVSRVTRSTKKWKEIYYSHLLSKVRTGSWKFIYHTLIHTYEKAVVKLKSSVNCSSGTTILGSSPNTYP
jgi:hypothetical protein